MPLYEYKCLSCGKVFEVIAKFSDPPLEKHAECGGEVERLPSAPAFHLKGTGWYATDYAKKSNPSSDKSDKSEKSDDKKSDSKSDSDKPAETKPAATETKSETKSSTSDTK